MKKKILFLLIPFLFYGCGYNAMVSLDEGVQSSWSQVENQYQRRSDLIPNLVETVKGYAKQEKETLVEVMEARAKATSIQVSPRDGDSMESFQEAQGELSSSLSRLLVAVEAYPDLKSDALFSDLMHQLEGTENRITVARMDYNESVKVFNTMIRRFPQIFYAGRMGFEAYSYFEAEKGADKAPEVNFGD